MYRYMHLQICKDNLHIRINTTITYMHIRHIYMPLLLFVGEIHIDIFINNKSAPEHEIKSMFNSFDG